MSRLRETILKRGPKLLHLVERHGRGWRSRVIDPNRASHAELVRWKTYWQSRVPWHVFQSTFYPRPERSRGR